MKKLHEWEVMKGFKQEEHCEHAQRVEYHHSLSQVAQSQPSHKSRDRILSDGALQLLQKPETRGTDSHTPRSSNSSSPGESRRSCEHLIADHDTFQPARVLVDDSTSVDLNLTTCSVSRSV